jgi:hypothetical protein
MEVELATEKEPANALVPLVSELMMVLEREKHWYLASANVSVLRTAGLLTLPVPLNLAGTRYARLAFWMVAGSSLEQH